MGRDESPVRVQRTICGFDRTDALVSEHLVPESWSLERLQALFEVPREDPMYEVFPIAEPHRQLLLDTVGADTSPEHAYFLYAHAVADSEAAPPPSIPCRRGTAAPPRVERLIRGFDARDALVSEHRIPEAWTLARLQARFGVPADNPMYDCFPIGDAHRQVLVDTVGADVSPDVHYFVEADAIDD